MGADFFQSFVVGVQIVEINQSAQDGDCAGSVRVGFVFGDVGFGDDAEKFFIFINDGEAADAFFRHLVNQLVHEVVWRCRVDASRHYLFCDHGVGVSTVGSI